MSKSEEDRGHKTEDADKKEGIKPCVFPRSFNPFWVVIRRFQNPAEASVSPQKEPASQNISAQNTGNMEAVEQLRAIICGLQG